MAKKGKKKTAIAAGRGQAPKSSQTQKLPVPKKVLTKGGKLTSTGKKIALDFTNAFMLNGFMLAAAFFNVVSTYEGINVPDEQTQKDVLIKNLYNATHKGSKILYRLWQVCRFSLSKDDLEMNYNKALRAGKKINFNEMTGGDKLLYIKLMIETDIVNPPSKERPKKKQKKRTDNDDNNNNNNSSRGSAPVAMNLEAPQRKKLRKPKLFGKLSQVNSGKSTIFEKALNGIKSLGVQSVINSMYVASFLFPGLNYGTFQTDTEEINDGHSTMVNTIVEDDEGAKHVVRSSTLFNVDKGLVTGGTAKPTLHFKKPGKLVNELGEFTIQDDLDYNKAMQSTVFNSDENSVMFNLFYIMVNVLMKYCVVEGRNGVMPMNLEFNSAEAILKFNVGLQNLMQNIKIIAPTMNLADVLKDVFRIDILPNCLGAGSNAVRPENMSDFYQACKMGTSNGLDGSIFYSIWSLFRLNKLSIYTHKDPNASKMEHLQHFFFNDVFVVFVENLKLAVDLKEFIPSVRTIFDIFITSFNTVREDYATKLAEEQMKTKKNTEAGLSRTKSTERVAKNSKSWMGIIMDFCRLQLFKTLCDVVQFDAVEHPNNNSAETGVNGSKRGTNKQSNPWHQSGISRAEMVDVVTGAPTMLYAHEAKRWHIGFKLDKQLCPKVESLYGDRKLGLFSGFSSFFSKEAMNGDTARMSVNFLWKAMIHKLYFTRVYLSGREMVKSKPVKVNGVLVKQLKGCYGYPKILFTKNPGNNNNNNEYGGYVCDRQGQVPHLKEKKMVIDGDVVLVNMSMSSWYLGQYKKGKATDEYWEAVNNKTLKGKERNEARKKLMAFSGAPDRIRGAISMLRAFSEQPLESMEIPTVKSGLSDATAHLVGHASHIGRVFPDMLKHLKDSSELVRKNGNGIWMKPVSMMSMIVQLIILAMTVLDMEIGPEVFAVLYPNNSPVSKYGKDHSWHLAHEKHITDLFTLMVKVFVIKAPYTAALFAPFETLKQLFKSHLGLNIQPYKTPLHTGSGSSSMMMTPKTVTTTRPTADTKADRRYYINAMMNKLRQLFDEAVKVHNNSNGGRVKALRVVVKPSTIHQHLLKGNDAPVVVEDIQASLQAEWGNVNKKDLLDHKQMEEAAAKENALDEDMFDMEDLDDFDSDDDDL